ncbi:MAG TPA: carboxypeptidase regulatory-like domain-containing protein [Vicinamibacterales bacterium]|nr:carboxypeptidase regulatory-like domain-containing protein [Vicinamibacterales bacterium]
MRSTIWFSLALVLVASTSSAQAPTPPATPAPAPAAPPRQTPPAATPARRPTPAPSRAGIAITVTNARGATLAGVDVEVLGVSDRSGSTNESGQVSFVGMQAGTYRLRFSGDEVITFEREIVVRAGQTTSADVTLNPAPMPEPAPPPPAAAPAPTPSPVGPAGKPQTLTIVDLIERELIGNGEPRRETLVACSGNTRTTLVQLNENQPDRRYDTAEVAYYVVAGEGAVRISARDMTIGASSFVSLPRGTTHSLTRRGRRPLILLATLSGAPCEEAR